MQLQRLAAIGTALGLLLGGGVLAAVVHAQSSPLKISNAWARRAPMGHGSMGAMGKEGKGGMATTGMGGGTGAIYVTIANTGPQADALVAASSNVAQTVELHQTTNEGGVMKMRPVPSIPVPAGGKVEMKPGGYHIMLLGLTRDLKPGDTVPVTLKFTHGGEVSVDASVR